jgi:hypothetical protein
VRAFLSADVWDVQHDGLRVVGTVDDVEKRGSRKVYNELVRLPLKGESCRFEEQYNCRILSRPDCIVVNIFYRVYSRTRLPFHGQAN